MAGAIMIMNSTTYSNPPLPPPEPPPAPILISPTNGFTVSDTSITFQWNSSSGATNYQIRVSVDPAVEDPLFHEDLTAGATSKNYTDFPNDGTVYYWKVRASNAVGYGNWSTIWSFTNGDDVPVVESGHVGYYDLAPWGTRFFKFVSDVPSCTQSIQVSNTPGSSDEPCTVHLLIKRGGKPTIAEFESTWEMPASHYDCDLEKWIPTKDPSAEDLYWKYNTGPHAEFVKVNEPMGSYTFYIMLYNAGGEAVNNQYLTVHYNV
jgi:hypothetical protein